MASVCRSLSIRYRRGVTLAEAVLTLLILSMFLVAIARLMTEVSDVQRFWGAKESSAEKNRRIAILIVMSLSSISILQPGLVSANAVLEFLRIDPDIDAAASRRLPAQLSPTPSPVPAAPWDPRDPTFLMTVRYAVNPQGQLVRTATSTSTYTGPAFSVSSVVASGISSFESQNSAGRALWLRLDFLEAKQTRRYRVSVYIGEGTEWL